MLSVSMEQGMMDMADMAKIEAERKVLPLSVLKQKCRMMSKEAAGVDGYVCAEPVIDEYMVYAAKAGGEKAVVIDVSLVDRERAVFFSKLARFVGISCVFQVHTFNQVSRAVSLGASAVQIPDADRAAILSGTVPRDVPCFLPSEACFAGHARKTEAVPAV